MFKIIFLVVFPLMVLADISLNGLPLITNVTQVQTNDTFPIVNNFGPPTTKKLYISDILNVTAFQNKFATLAPLANPIFTGTVVGNFAGPLNGTATNVTGVVAIANGGTGASTKDNGLNNLLPVQTGLSGKALTTNGSSTLWSSVVNTVNGYFGNVILTKSDIGLGNVDNTADIDKPISAADRVALNLKAPLLSPALTGIPTAPTAALATNTNQIATTAFVLANAPPPPPSANQYLSNLLSPVAINQTLLPATNFGVSVGSDTMGFNTFYGLNMRTDASLNIAISNRQLFGAINIVSLDYGNRILKNLSGNTALDWSGSGVSLTGIPTAPTAAFGDNSTQIATTAFVAASSPPAANQYLSNLLSPVAINQTLKPAVNYGTDVGAPSKPFGGFWGNYYGFVSNIGTVPTAFGYIETSQNQATPSGDTALGIFWHTITDKNYGIALFTEQSNTSNSGKLIFETGNAGATGFRSGDISLRTGTGVLNSGNIILRTGVPTLGTRGTINFVENSLATSSAGYVWTLNNSATGEGKWSTTASGGANTFLSNLVSPTAINQDLLPATDGTKNIGSSTQKFATVNAVSIAAYSPIDPNDALVLQKRTVGALFPHTVDSKILGSFGTVGLGQSPLAIVTQNDAAVSADSSFGISVLTGNKTAGTGGSGNISLKTGTSLGGVRGTIYLDGSAIDLNGTKLINKAPLGQQVSSYSNGNSNLDLTAAGTVTIANLTVTIPTTGRPVTLGLLNDQNLTGFGHSGVSLSYSSPGGVGLTLHYLRDGVVINSMQVESGGSGVLATRTAFSIGSFGFLDVGAAAGTHTYTVTATMEIAQGTATIYPCKLFAFEQ